MKKVFDVKMYLNDGSTNNYIISANDDLIARELAIKMEKQSWKDFGDKSDDPGVSYCEIKKICTLDN